MEKNSSWINGTKQNVRDKSRLLPLAGNLNSNIVASAVPSLGLLLPGVRGLSSIHKLNAHTHLQCNFPKLFAKIGTKAWRSLLPRYNEKRPTSCGFELCFKPWKMYSLCHRASSDISQSSKQHSKHTLVGLFCQVSLQRDQRALALSFDLKMSLQ